MYCIREKLSGSVPVLDYICVFKKLLTHLAEAKSEPVTFRTMLPIKVIFTPLKDKAKSPDI